MARLETFAEDLLSEKDIRHLAPIRFGLMNEPVAINLFEEKTGLSSDKCGLFVMSENPYIGASPDRIVVEGGVRKTVEVKCSYTLSKAKDPVQKEINERNLNQILELVDGRLSLRKSHDYYFQVQGQMLCAKTEETYFVVYNGVDIEYFIVKRDEEFIKSMLHKLKAFNKMVFRETVLTHFFYRDSADFSSHY